MAKVTRVLYDDPVDGYPKWYPRDDVPQAGALSRWPGVADLAEDRSQARRPSRLRFGGLGLRESLEEDGHDLVVTSSKDGPDSVVRETPFPKPLNPPVPRPQHPGAS